MTHHEPKEDRADPQTADGVGLGIDIVAIARMRGILERTPRFRTRVFTEGERAYCDATSQPAVHYATRFAAKEAVLKALGTGFSAGIGPQDVEVARTSKGRPYAKLHRRASEAARALGVVDLPISLSFTHEEAVACAMAITSDALSAAAKRKDPMEELSRQFKEARLMLDDLPATGAETASGAEGEDAPDADSQDAMPGVEGASPSGPSPAAGAKAQAAMPCASAGVRALPGMEDMESAQGAAMGRLGADGA